MGEVIFIIIFIVMYLSVYLVPPCSLLFLILSIVRFVRRRKEIPVQTTIQLIISLVLFAIVAYLVIGFSTGYLRISFM